MDLNELKIKIEKLAEELGGSPENMGAVISGLNNDYIQNALNGSDEKTAVKIEEFFTSREYAFSIYTEEQQNIIRNFEKRILDMGGAGKALENSGISASAMSSLRRETYKGVTENVFSKISSFLELKNDHCKPHANRKKDNIYANDVWIMDNYTIDVIIKNNRNSKGTRRLYITTVLDAKSNVLVGWNITENPDSNSTLDALRFAMLRFGIPEFLYFDNGREFTTLDIAGEQRTRKVSKDKKGNIPLTIAEKLGVKLIFAKVTNAQAKVVERIHRIIKEQYCTAQYGYCGGNVVERPEIIKQNIKNGNIETEQELHETFADFADNIYNVQPYGSSEPKYKGMTLIDVWNESIAETSIKKSK